MNALDLPVLVIETPLKEAFSTMKKSERSAVLATDREGCWLFKAGWIAVGISHGDKILADLKHRHRVYRPSQNEARGIDWERPVKTSTAVKTLLYTAGTSHMVLSPLPLAGKTARIIMMREPLADDIGLGPSDCYCTDPPAGHDPHDYNRGDVPPDRKCYRDGSQIVCYP
jgi:hypothetical protein